jgi:ribonucleoside-diphosphate reductase alpha subunit
MLRVYNNTARYVNQCFTPETLIKTRDGQKCIVDVVPGDDVLTLDGSFQQVLLSVKHIKTDADILEIDSPYMSRPVRVTDVHEIYVMDCATLEKKYIPARELDYDTHMLCFPIQVESHINLSEKARNMLTFCGLFKQNGRIFANGYDYSIRTNKDDVFNLVTKTLKSCHVKYWIYHNKSNDYKIVRWVKSPLMPCLTSTSIALENGHTGAAAYLKGLFMNSIYIKSTYIEVETKEQAFEYQMIAVNAHKLLHSIEHSPDKFMMCVSNDNDYFVEDKHMWFVFDSIKTINYSGFVYDLNIQDNHNYTTSMGVVHNSGRRNGSIAVYMEPWHADIEQFIELRKNHGNEEERARDLFYALWIPDLFMKRVEENKMWSLMCPDTCKGLSDCYGDEFEKLYTDYEDKKMFYKQIPAQQLFFKILENQIETGTPYMLYKDHVNNKNMQQNIGIIKSSNLCSEIVEYSDSKNCAVCNLASMCLPTYIDEKTKIFDYKKLHTNVKIVVKNLNKVIDRNFYPVEEAKLSNLRDRPIGIGIQGLADVFAILKIAFESDEAKEINLKIFQTMYHAALESSMELAKKIGPYATFPGSPASQGILQFDMWKVTPSDMYDWAVLKEQIKENGLRNSLLLAPMPTASTSQIMGFTESFEPITSNMYKRKTIAGEFIVVNKYLVRDLEEIGLWNHDIRNHIIVNDGSIQKIVAIPKEVRDRYKTVWECKMRNIIDMAADRGAFIDQSQSMNLYVESPDFKKLTAMHFYSWKKGLKTGMYYLRTKGKSAAQKFTVDPRLEKQLKDQNDNVEEEEELGVCESCSA